MMWKQFAYIVYLFLAYFPKYPTFRCLIDRRIGIGGSGENTDMNLYLHILGVNGWNAKNCWQNLEKYNKITDKQEDLLNIFTSKTLYGKS